MDKGAMAGLVSGATISPWFQWIVDGMQACPRVGVTGISLYLFLRFFSRQRGEATREGGAAPNTCDCLLDLAFLGLHAADVYGPHLETQYLTSLAWSKRMQPIE
jgi:hypothetical protein